MQEAFKIKKKTKELDLYVFLIYFPVILNFEKLKQKIPSKLIAKYEKQAHKFFFSGFKVNSIQKKFFFKFSKLLQQQL